MAHRVERVLIRSTTIVIHPAPNENAWLRGQAALRNGSVKLQEHVGLVAARGLEPAIPTCRIVVPSWIAARLAFQAQA
jgi:hypothetical protein